MKRIKILSIAIVVFTIFLSSFSFYAYQIFFTPNILVDKGDQYFPIYPGTTFKELQDQLYKQNIVNDLISFSFLARLKDYDKLIKPGMYLLKKDMSNNDAINMLRAGMQTPIKLTFSNARKLEDLASKLTDNLAIDSVDMQALLASDSVAEAYGFNKQTFISMFLPNTYEVYWTASATEILNRLKSEYDKFWNEERRNKAQALNLTPVKVSTLASIVDSETNFMDEAPRISGVYLNRLERGYHLQADPTLVFAVGDFTIRRVLDVHKKIDSPYNTYKYRGLPPGPIMMPSISAIEAVLNTEEHSYLYFCAKEDFSGYHVFAKTLSEHNANARRFQQALNKQRIYR
ncbi:endolytic transglycosylase MltG [Marinoscillum sp. MHG1-6]|uniref:endolytic transglycosylase MltG n=1 Tax=Marinoscillum sp. MHG1-6 TaxID=2959627 RepID=UPI0021572F9A|nr:endolytic transglycosylase MltG [Marinoscillum sp. MHG1-6]